LEDKIITCRINQYIDCANGTTIDANQQICINAPSLKIPSQQFMSSAVQQFSGLNPQLQTLYNNLQANPTQAVSILRKKY
jgi:hypothetical protein